MARLEAVLFLAKQPLASRKLSQLAGLADGTEARTLLRGLNRFYDEARSAFRVEEFAGGFQLLTRPKFAPWLRRLHDSPLEMRLSAPAMETLAVVAYRQPVLRVEVESIRGVQCGEILRQLMQRDLVRIVGRSDELGRPFLYGTTKHFLQVFGLRSLEELPRAETIQFSIETNQEESEVTTQEQKQQRMTAEGDPSPGIKPRPLVAPPASPDGDNEQDSFEEDDEEEHDEDADDDFDEDDDEEEDEEEEEEVDDDDDGFEENEWKEVGDDDDDEDEDEDEERDEEEADDK
ncbi:MAG: SMC-Scp complex subunit ScpB [Planctomycetes bacterium]|nr:SMC-Scp complex subunit ScpB [Planctomycetota bacterium]